MEQLRRQNLWAGRIMGHGWWRKPSEPPLDPPERKFIGSGSYVYELGFDDKSHELVVNLGDFDECLGVDMLRHGRCRRLSRDLAEKVTAHFLDHYEPEKDDGRF